MSELDLKKIKPAWQRLGFASKQDMIDHGRIYDEQRKRN